MKKTIICAMLLIIATATFSQQTKSSPTLTKQDYLQKSKNRKKVARIMLGGGATLILTGIIIPKGEVINGGIGVPQYQTEYKNDGIKGAFYLCGTLSMLGSIPFFISSHHNKKMAAALSFKNEIVPQIQKNSFVYTPVPSLILKISL
jgi:hypothetical protein